MPISQTRFMTVIEYARRLISWQDKIRDLIGDANQIIARANSYLDRGSDPVAINIIKELISVSARLDQYVIDLNMDPTNRELQAIVLAEYQHFKKVGQRNERSADSQRYQRLRNKVKQKQPEAELRPQTIDIRKSFIQPRTPSPQGELPVATQKQVATPQYGPGAVLMTPDGPKKLPSDQEVERMMQELIAREKSSSEPQASYHVNSAEGAQERAKNVGTGQDNPIQTAGIGNSSDDRERDSISGQGYGGSVTRTSTPSLEELNRLPFEPGKNVL